MGVWGMRTFVSCDGVYQLLVMVVIVANLPILQQILKVIISKIYLINIFGK